MSALIASDGPWRNAGVHLSLCAIFLAGIAEASGDRFAIWTGLALFLAGLPHGAGDEQDGQIRRISLAHALGYVIVAGAVTGLFLILPIAGLSLFIGLSGWHFARSECGLSPINRYAIAGLAIGGSALFKPEATRSVFAEVIAAQMPSIYVSILAISGLLGAGFALWAVARRERGFGRSLLALGAVALMHPVLAVGLIFLTAHAIPVQQRQASSYGQDSVLSAVAIPTVLAVAGAAIMIWGVTADAITVPVAIALSMGMATPHMLTERLEA